MSDELWALARAVWRYLRRRSAWEIRKVLMRIPGRRSTRWLAAWTVLMDESVMYRMRLTGGDMHVTPMGRTATLAYNEFIGRGVTPEGGSTT